MDGRMADDYYQLLWVNRTAAADDIKKAFKKLARKYHPDLNPGDKDAEKRFKQISEAYDVLSDAEKRKKYDQFGPNFASYAGAGPGGPQGGAYGRGPFQGGGGFQYQTGRMEDFEDIFGDLFGGAAGMGGARRGRRGAGAGRPGNDIEAQIELDFEEAALGCEKRLSLSPTNVFT